MNRVSLLGKIVLRMNELIEVINIHKKNHSPKWHKKIKLQDEENCLAKKESLQNVLK